MADGNVIKRLKPPSTGKNKIKFDRDANFGKQNAHLSSLLILSILKLLILPSRDLLHEGLCPNPLSLKPLQL